jgi:hypothetical protein
LTEGAARGANRPGMRRSEEYRRQAAEAETLAGAMAREDFRKAALRLADEWRKLAEAAERQEGRGTDIGCS